MPIPQPSKKNKIPQSWRDDKITDSVRQRIQQSRQLRTGGGRAGQFSSWRAQTPSHKKKSYRPSPLMLYRLLKLALILVIFGVIYFLWISRDLPNPNKLIDRDIAESTKIYDRTGETILYEIYQMTNQSQKSPHKIIILVLSHKRLIIFLYQNLLPRH